MPVTKICYLRLDRQTQPLAGSHHHPITQAALPILRIRSMTENQIARLGVDASIVLDNEAFKQAMESLKSQVSAQLLDCPIRDREGMVLLLQLSKLTAKFEGILTGMVANGRFTQAKIDLDKERNETRSQKWLRKVNG